MTWDNAGRRLKLVTSGGTTWQFVYDPTASNPAVLAELNGSSEVDYIREPDGSLVARDDPAASSYSYYLFDPVGSTIAMVPAVEGSPTDRFYYDPWGQIITSDPNGRQSTIGTADNPYRYVGQLGYYYHQQDSNLQSWLELGVRFYDPSLGRFERRDPLSRTTTYSYGSNNPLLYCDPQGLLAGRYEKCACWCSAPLQPGVRGVIKYLFDQYMCKKCKQGVELACKEDRDSCCALDDFHCEKVCHDTMKTARGRDVCVEKCWVKYEACIITGNAFE